MLAGSTAFYLGVSQHPHNTTKRRKARSLISVPVGAGGLGGGWDGPRGPQGPRPTGPDPLAGPAPALPGGGAGNTANVILSNSHPAWHVGQKAGIRARMSVGAGGLGGGWVGPMAPQGPRPTGPDPLAGPAPALPGGGPGNTANVILSNSHPAWHVGQKAGIRARMSVGAGGLGGGWVGPRGPQGPRPTGPDPLPGPAPDLPGGGGREHRERHPVQLPPGLARGPESGNPGSDARRGRRFGGRVGRSQGPPGPQTHRARPPAGACAGSARGRGREHRERHPVQLPPGLARGPESGNPGSDARLGRRFGGRAGRSQGPPGPQTHRARPPAGACAGLPGGGARQHRERHPVQLPPGLARGPESGNPGSDVGRWAGPGGRAGRSQGPAGPQTHRARPPAGACAGSARGRGREHRERHPVQLPPGLARGRKSGNPSSDVGRWAGPGGRAGRSQGPPGPQTHRARPPAGACAGLPGGGARQHRERHPVQLPPGLARGQKSGNPGSDVGRGAGSGGRAGRSQGPPGPQTHRARPPAGACAAPPRGWGPGTPRTSSCPTRPRPCQIQPGKLSIACGASGGGRAPGGGWGGPRAPQGPRPTGPDPLPGPVPPPPGVGPGNTANVILSNSTSALPNPAWQVIYSLRCVGRGAGSRGRVGRSQGPPGPQTHRARPPAGACAAPPGGGAREHRERHPVQLDLGLAKSSLASYL